MAKSIRLQALEATFRAGAGHLGGTFSCVELLVYLYYNMLEIKDDPRDPLRDRFILSKGHACLALFPILVDLGFMKQEQFDTYGEDGGLGGQIDISMPGVDWNTGSLGHSVGVCAGMALAAKLDKQDFCAYTVIGDAECVEGSVWEAITFAGDHQLDNLVCIVDRNRLSVTDVLGDDTFFRGYPKALQQLGWRCFEMNGHSFEDMDRVFYEVNLSSRPSMIIANTIKGKGVSFMENDAKWHHGCPTKEQMEIARKELS